MSRAFNLGEQSFTLFQQSAYWLPDFFFTLLRSGVTARTEPVTLAIANSEVSIHLPLQLLLRNPFLVQVPGVTSVWFLASLRDLE